MKMTRSVTLFGIALASAFTASAGTVEQTERAMGAQVPAALRIVPNALLSIDQNRSTVVDRIVGEWSDALARTNAGISADQLRATLLAMRSDYLLAASISGSLDGLRNVIESSLNGSEPGSARRSVIKTLGNANDDLVYTPVVPCRLADTRIAGGPIAGGGGRDFKVWVASGGFTAQGGDAGNCNIPANPAAVVLNLAVVNMQGSGNLIAYATGGAVPNTSALNYTSGVFALSNGATVPACTPNCLNQVTINANTSGTDLVIDVVGYFRPPTGGFVASVAAGSGISLSGTAANPTVGVAAGGVTAAMMASNSCSSGQVLKWNGSAWACAADAAGSGTVTSVASGTGLTGGPITTTGTLNLAGSYQLPQLCTNGQVATSNGAGGWTCTTPTSGTGTVTSVGTGAGLSGGPITASGTVSLLATNLLPTVACAATQIPRWSGSAWACGNDVDTNSGGTVTQVSTGTGLTGGPITGSGTVGLAATNLLPAVACAMDQIPKWNGSAWACAADSAGPATAFVQNGNAFAATAVLGTTDDNALDIRANSSRVMRYEPNAISPNVIGGQPLNFAAPGVRGATIAGGGSPVGGDPDFNFEGPNRVLDIYGTVSGGYNNQAGNGGAPNGDGVFATIGGGIGHVASGSWSTISGGDISVASGNWSTVGGGINHLASGFGSTVSGGGAGHATGTWATVAGGNNNTASGAFSFASGRRAKTQSADPIPVVHDGALVWADSNDFDFNSTLANQFAVRATGGARIVLGIDGTGASTWTCSVASGGSWACSSDRNLKQNLRQLDGQTVLGKLAAMPIYSWNPKGENAHHRHFGPTAQDFHAAFGLGDSELRIGQQDADGVALAAIQGLNAKLDSAIADRDARITAQAQEITELRRAIEVLMARTSPEGKVAHAR